MGIEKDWIQMPAHNKYEKMWAKVDSLDQKQLTRSALDVVNKIHEKAVKEKNQVQTIKALIHKIKYEDLMDDGNGFEKSITSLENEAKKAAFPMKNMLHSMIGEGYFRYYQNNRWRFYERTELTQPVSEDIETWDLKKIAQTIIKHNELALQNADSLQRIQLSYFDDILTVQKESKEFRPTVYDFIAHRALDIFANEELSLTQPEDVFELNTSDFFSSNEEFVKLKIQHTDSTSQKLISIKLWQDLTQFHLHDVDQQALIDVSIQRLSYVNQKSTLENKQNLYLNALKVLEKKFETLPMSTEISYQVALILNNESSKYNAKDTSTLEYRWLKKEALRVCNEAIRRFPKSKASANCEYLKQEILRPTLTFENEEVLAPEKEALSLLSYKNVDQVYYKLILINFEEHKSKTTRKNQEQIIAYYNSLTAVKSWQIDIQNELDYQPHTTEFILPALTRGFYILLASTSPQFSIKDQVVAYTDMWVSNIAAYTKRDRNETRFFVMERCNGKPLENAKVSLFRQSYDYQVGGNFEKKVGDYIINKDGYIILPAAKENEYGYLRAKINFNGDHLQDLNISHNHNSHGIEEATQQTHFFTDRAIYRPGQTIYFKGIVIESLKEEKKMLPDFKTTISLYDVNYQKISSVEVKTNEFGSFQGSFQMPTGLLNGRMNIKDEITESEQYLSVEEYKRPKFEVDFQPVKGTFVVNDSVKVTGFAKTYSGANLDGAKITYRVVRTVHFPMYWSYYRMPFYRGSSQEIGKGTILSKQDGTFDVIFKAIPDLGVNKKYTPNFTYTVYADVTDINGETQSSSTYVEVGYESIRLSTHLPDQVLKDVETKIEVSSTNLMGVKTSVDVTLEISKLKHPEHYYKTKFWDSPDNYTIEESKFHDLFPNDVYKGEDDYTTWPKEKLIFSKLFNTGKDSSFVLSDIKTWPSGKYYVLAKCKDKFGNEVKTEQYVTVFSAEDKKVPTNEVFWVYGANQAFEPGQTAEIALGSSEKDVMILYELESHGNIIHREYVSLDYEVKKLKIPVSDYHRGNIFAHFTLIKDNRFYHEVKTIQVPWSNKKLNVELETFRSKLYPGAKEEWKIKIKGPDGQIASAELLASMYDASLDAFAANDWDFTLFSYRGSEISNEPLKTESEQSRVVYDRTNFYPNTNYRYYDELNWFGMNWLNNRRDYAYDSYRNEGLYVQKASSTSKSARAAMAVTMAEENAPEVKKKGDIVMGGLPAQFGDGKPIVSKSNEAPVQMRKNLQETAFFFPQLKTDEKGDVIFSFTSPEALTRWKFMTLAHSKDLQVGSLVKEVVTQKELMIIPNFPRFFRQGDAMQLQAKINNLSDQNLSGRAELEFLDVLTLQPITNQLIKERQVVDFQSNNGSNTVVSWNIIIPENLEAVTYRIKAITESFSDGEEAFIPVVTNRMLVTESMPLPIRPNQTKTFTFEKLLNQSSITLKNHSVTLEFTSNPVWYAVQALPYMAEYPYECSEQLFTRYYANSLASHIANSHPKIKSVMEVWKTKSPSALLSNLEKNQELKTALLEETPWVLEAKSESEQKKKVAVLFDIMRMKDEKAAALKKLQDNQLPNGAWPWFKGMYESRYITQYIVSGLGHLKHLGAIPEINKALPEALEGQTIDFMSQKAIQYLDNQITRDYQEMLKWNKKDMDKVQISYFHVQYFYARSFYKEIPVDKSNKTAYDYYFKQMKQYWTSFPKYIQGMSALSLHRAGEAAVASDIMKALKENAIFNEELGMYWKEIVNGYNWHEAAIESQALLIEAFDEVAKDQKSVEELKIWLLKQKQTQNWKTTKATAEACYALLLKGTNVLTESKLVDIKVGDQKVIISGQDDTQIEAGTGYFKTVWHKESVKKEIGKVEVTNPNKNVAWGAMYWQYFEDLDKITPASTPLKIEKKVFREDMGKTGPILSLVDDKTTLKVGDKVKVRIELRVDRTMEFVHMKDMRAAGLEPLNVISGHQWQDGLGYYQSTKDMSTNFFFDNLPKGTYVFEYALRVNNAGDFSNGVTTIQCMYAPEFTSHSEGIRLLIK